MFSIDFLLYIATEGCISEGRKGQNPPETQKPAAQGRPLQETLWQMVGTRNMLELIVFLLIILPGILLAVRGSSYVVDYTILVFVFNREIRRLIDYHNQQFNPFSLISITPIIMLGLLFLGFAWNFGVLHGRPKQIFILLLAAIGYGLAVGLFRNGVASVYQGSEYLSTIGLMGYAAVSPADDTTADRWLRTAGSAAVLAALYGWYQYFTIPGWDAFWVEQVGFVGYLGKLEPTQIWVFSTFAERGVCAAYLGLAAIPMLASRRWRVVFGWPEALLILSCIFLTYSRCGIIIVLVGAALYPIMNKGKNWARIVISAALVCGILFGALSTVPGAAGIKTRFESLLHMQDDSSLQGRLSIVQAGWPIVLGNPAGFGIGSSGMAQRLNGNAQGVISDDGWLEIAASLGVPGFLLFIGALVLLWRYFSILERLGVQDDYLSLARTFLVASLILMWDNNFFMDFSMMWIALGRALSPMMLGKMYPEVREILEPRTAEATS